MPINAWSIEDVRSAEAATMATLPEGELMQRAARGLAHVVAARLRDIEAPRVVVLAGPGGNGGDALFAAAFLADGSVSVADAEDAADADAADSDGTVSVAAVLLTSNSHAPALAAARAAGVVLHEARSDSDDEAVQRALAAVSEADVVVDGITGIGGRPGLAEGFPVAWRLVQAIPDDAYVMAVDLPSGTDPAGERTVSDCVFADETVTFGVCKPVHVLAGGPACGLLTVVDIGLDDPGEPVAARLEHDDVAGLWPVPGPADDKYTRGVLGIVAGGDRYTGAAVLSVTAAVSAGAGMVRYVGPSAATDLVRASVPEAVHGVGRVQAWLVGSGLEALEDGDQGEEQRAQLDAARAALDSAEPCVVDAGGLDLLDGPRPHAGARTLLTPHAGELARLLSRLEGADVDAVDAEAVRAAPIEHARRAATALHATVLLKGSTTYVVPPVDALPVYAQADGPAWLGTAGSGDVLAGLAGTLLAGGLDPLRAGALAALVHGLAGHEANPGGPVRALDVAHAIPRVVAHTLRRAQR